MGWLILENDQILPLFFFFFWCFPTAYSVTQLIEGSLWARLLQTRELLPITRVVGNSQYLVPVSICNGWAKAKWYKGPGDRDNDSMSCHPPNVPCNYWNFRGNFTKFKWKLWIKEAPFSSAFPYAMTSKKYLLSYGLPQKYTTSRLITKTTFPYTVDLVKSTCSNGFRLQSEKGAYAVLMSPIDFVDIPS